MLNVECKWIVMERYFVVFCTVPSKEEGEKIAHALLEKRLAACVNIAGGINSWFWWQGKIDNVSEYLLIIKTTVQRYLELENEIVRLHPYELPEIIAMPIVQGSRAYLDWIDGSV